MTVLPDSYAGACDCHIHVFEDGRPLVPTATFKPPHAPAAAYREVQRALGLSRVVVVQPTGYGYENSCTLDAMKQLGPGARGVAVVPLDAPQAQLEQLDEAGMRGVRFMMLPGGILPWANLEPMAARIAPMGWNINLQLDGRDLPLHEAVLHRLPCRLVIDHIGKFLGPVALGDEAVSSLCRLLDTGNCWIKLSAPYESSRSGAPAYADVSPLVRALAGSYPERCLWASNWPHPNINPTPTDGYLLEWALLNMGTAETRHRILVDNPTTLYGF